jgi:outer membrane immunogenic protein
MKKQLLLGAAFGALVGANPLLAADLAVKAPIYNPAPVAVYNWTGCYAGGNVGYSWGRSSGEFDFPGLSNRFITPAVATLYPLSSDPQGVIGGVQIGCNRQFDNRWVLGIEADIQGSAQKASRSLSSFNTFGEGFSGRFESQLRWFGTVRGVAGFLLTPTVMLYGTGGLAYGEARLSSTVTVNPFGNLNSTTTTSLSSSATNVGYAVGAGIAGAFPNSSNWTWKLEYLYLDLGSVSLAGTERTLGTYNWSTRITDNIVRVGVNYRFNDWAMTPVVAKY